MVDFSGVPEVAHTPTRTLVRLYLAI